MAAELSPDGTEWVYSVPESWRVEPLKCHCSMFKGLPILKTDLVEEGVPVISYGQIHSKDNTGTHLDDSLLRFIPAARVSGNESSKLQRSDVVFADTSEDVEGIGNAALIDTDDVVYAGYHTVTCRPNQTSLSGHYLAYLARTDAWRYQLRNLAMGVKVFSITQAILRKAEVLLPPRDEQERIADFLDDQCAEIDTAADLICRQITSLELYRRSIIHEAVTKGLNPNVSMKPSGVEWMGDIPNTWVVRKLKHLVKRFESGTSVRAAAYPANQDEIGVLSLSSVFGGSFHPQENKRVDDDECSRVSCPVRGGTLLISRCNTSEWVGLPAYIESDCPNLYLPDKLWQVDCGSSAINRFLWYSLRSKYAREYCAAMSVGASSSMQNIASFDLLNMFVPMPASTREIVDIAQYLDERCTTIDAVIDTKRKQRDVLKKHRQSLIYEYVTGKRRVGTKG